VNRTFFTLALLLGLISCSSPNVTPTEAEYKSPIGDPLYTTDAPPLVRFGEIKVASQPDPGPYPPIAVAGGIQGDVLVEIWIDEKGNPTKAVALWGTNELREKAVEYALRWKFRPFNIEARPSPVRFRMPMPFRLRKGGPISHMPPAWRF